MKDIKTSNMVAKRLSRIGETMTNTMGTVMKIIEYNHYEDILVEFENNATVRASYGNFKKGSVNSPNDKTLYGIGYVGVGNHKQQGAVYTCWCNMIKRCYHKQYQMKNVAYIGCTVDERWHNFQNFANWYEKNFYKVPGERVALDKDILIKNNKLYSEDTCIFVPSRINNLFIISNRSELPVGVQKTNRVSNPYIAVLVKHNGDESVRKVFSNSTDAFLFYKKHKELYIKEVAEEYKSIIPTKLYEAMYKYRVEITD